MKRKNPWIAAIGNFLFQGIGFIYLEATPFVLIGAILFVYTLIGTAINWSTSTFLDPLTVISTFVHASLWAALGYVCAEYVNKCALQPPPSPPSEHMPPPPAPTPLPKIYCVYCGIENPIDAVFCQKCGKKMVKPT